MKKKLVAKPTTSKSRKASGNIDMATNLVYQVALKSLISSLVQHIPREILIEGSKYINTIYPKLKDRCLNSVMENDTVKRREIVWENVSDRILDVLHPLIQATNTEQKLLLKVPNSSAPASSGQDEKANSLMEVDHPEEFNRGDSRTLNHAIKIYAQSRPAKKKVT